MSQSNAILEVKDLCKSYGAIQAVQDVSLSFPENGIYGLYGRNGAGKTTLLDIISSRLYADRGSVSCFGKDISIHPDVMAMHCCYMPEKHYFPGSLKVKYLFSLAQSSFPRYCVDIEERLCRIFNLNTGQNYKQLSRGYQSIFRIVLGLAANAPITMFDEPVLGLDAVARDRFYQELIKAYSENPRLFILSTHLIEESADLFNEAIIIDQGQILRQAPVEELLASAFYVCGQTARVDAFTEKYTTLGSRTIGDLKNVVVEGSLSTKDRIPGLSFSPLTIQKLFIHLTDSDIEQE
ncbi:ABC transporter ATP-binding protein [bacterium]|nr:ABC transporter ATP-binding protein [bacterium]